MILYPAIDIQHQKVVRLKQGLFTESTEYSENPLSVARQWQDAGASWLHVIDLDGAQTGRIQNFETIALLAEQLDIPVQCGGGIRTRDDIAALMQAGVQRVILGTKIIEDLNFLKDLLRQWPDQIAVSLDCDQGRLTTRGWTKVTDIQAKDFAKELEDIGLSCLIYTDIKRDGMLTGPNYEALEELLAAINIPVIASGGIKDIQDIQKLKNLEGRGLAGAITGKAIYEGTLNLKEAIRICSQNE